MKRIWIEYWIESILGKIQILNWINLGIGQGYFKVRIIFKGDKSRQLWNSELTQEILGGASPDVSKF